MKISEEKYMLLAKYICREATDEENCRINAWLEQDESHLDFYLSLTGTAEKSGLLDNHGKTTPRAWEEICRQIKKEKPVTKPGRHQIKRVFARPAVAAASIIFILAMGWLASKMLFINDEQVVLKNSSSTGEMKIAYLPDSSKVFLNKSSTLRYNENFGERERRVQLSGEVFFEVSRHHGRPFVVETNHAEVTVLGTSFNVAAFEEASTTTIIVTEGKVSISTSTANRAFIEKGMKATIDNTTTAITSGTVQNYNEIAWKTKQLEFRETPLNMVLSNINSAYHSNIRFSNDKLNNCIFTGDFKNQSLDSIIEILSVAFSLEKRIDPGNDKTIIMTGDGCK